MVNEMYFSSFFFFFFFFFLKIIEIIVILHLVPDSHLNFDKIKVRHFDGAKRILPNRRCLLCHILIKIVLDLNEREFLYNFIYAY